MMGKGGKKKAIPIHISIFVRGAVNEVLFMLPSNYKYIYNLKYIKICARYKFQCSTGWQPAIVHDEVSSDFYGATLRAGLAGPCPINIRIFVSGSVLLLYQLRYRRAVSVRQVGLRPFKCTYICTFICTRKCTYGPSTWLRQLQPAL